MTVPGGGSQLGNFQVNVAKARALSLNPAPPPTQPLAPTLFGRVLKCHENVFLSIMYCTNILYLVIQFY